MSSLPNFPPRRRSGFQQVVAAFLAQPGLPFAEVLSAERMERIFTKHGNLFAVARIYSTAVMVWAFVGQVLSDGKHAACEAAVANIVAFRLQFALPSPTADTGDYCRARAKLSEAALREVAVDIAAEMEQQAAPAWLWKGQHAKLVDGFTFTMPDTVKNQRVYPSLKSQKKGVGLPIARGVVILSLATACVLDLAIGPYAGKETEKTKGKKQRGKKQRGHSTFYADRSLAREKLEIDSSKADRDRVKANALLYHDHANNMSEAEETFAKDLASAVQKRVIGMADANRAARIAEAKADSDDPHGYVRDDIALEFDIDNDDADAARALHAKTYTDDVITANQVRNSAKTGLIQEYHVAFHAKELTWTQNISDYHATHEIDLAWADRDRVVAVVAALGVFDNAVAAANVTWTGSVTTASETYFNHDANFTSQWNNADAEDLRDFQTLVAQNYVNAIDSWHQQTDTPWSKLYWDLAKAEKERVDAMSQANVDYVRDAGAAAVIRAGTTNAADGQYQRDQAAARQTETAARVTAVDDYAENVADAQVDLYVTMVAQAVTLHDKNVAGVNKTYQDAVAAEHRELQDALDAAEWKYRRTQAQADYEHRIATISEPSAYADNQRDLTMIQALEDRLEDQTSPRVESANELAIAYRTWVQDTGGHDVTLVADLGEAADALLAAVIDEIINLAGDEKAAAVEYATTMGAEGKVWDLAYAAAWAVEDNSLTTVGGTYNSTFDAQVSAELGKIDAALSAYQQAIQDEHQTSMQNASTGLAGGIGAAVQQVVDYQSAVAVANAARGAAGTTARAGLHQGLSTTSANLTSRLNIARAAHVQSLGSADVTYVGKIADAVTDQGIDYAAASGQWVIDFRTALAFRELDDLRATIAYAESRADARRDYRNELADAAVTWVGATAAATAELRLGNKTQEEYNDALDAANQQRESEHDTAVINHVEAIGQAQITRATALGDALIAQATGEGDAEITFAQAMKSADQTYAGKVTIAKLELADNTTTADKGLAEGIAAALRDRISELAPVETAYDAEQGQANTDRAEDAAEAQGGFFSGLLQGIASTVASWAPTAPTEQASQANLQAATANARATHASANQPAFKDLATQLAQEAGDHSQGVLAADHASSLLAAGGQVTYTSDRELLTKNYVTGTLAAQRGFQEGLLARAHQRDVDFTVADKDRMIDYAKAAKAHAVAVATAEADYQYNMVNPAEPTWTDEDIQQFKDVALAHAQYDRVVAEADADKKWIDATAAANKTFANNHVSAVEALKDTLAGLATTLTTGLVGKSAVLDAVLDAAGSTFSSLLTAAGNLLSSGIAAATSDFRGEDNSAKASATAGLDTAVATPFSGFAAGLSQTVSSWWDSAKQSYLDQTDDKNDAATTLTDTAATARATYTETVGTLTTTHANTVATAAETRENQIADAERAFVQALTGPTEKYIKDVSKAERDYKVAVALAERKNAAGQNDDGSPYGASQLAADKQTAEDAKTSAVKAAEQEYAQAHATASGDRKTSLAQAEQTYANTVASADHTLASGIAAARQTYTNTISAAHEAFVNTIAQIDSTFGTSFADSFADALANFAAADGTPWAQLEADKSNIEATRTSDVGQANETYVNTVASEKKTLNSALATADHDLIDATFGAAAAAINAITGAFGGVTIAQAAATNALAAAGAHQAKYPTLPRPAAFSENAFAIEQAAVKHFLPFEDPATNPHTTEINGAAASFITTSFAQQSAQLEAEPPKAEDFTVARLTTNRLQTGLVRNIADRPIWDPTATPEPATPPTEPADPDEPIQSAQGPAEGEFDTLPRNEVALNYPEDDSESALLDPKAVRPLIETDPSLSELVSTQEAERLIEELDPAFSARQLRAMMRIELYKAQLRKKGYLLYEDAGFTPGAKIGEFQGRDLTKPTVIVFDFVLPRRSSNHVDLYVFRTSDGRWWVKPQETVTFTNLAGASDYTIIVDDAIQMQSAALNGLERKYLLSGVVDALIPLPLNARDGTIINHLAMGFWEIAGWGDWYQLRYDLYTGVDPTEAYSRWAQTVAVDIAIELGTLGLAKLGGAVLKGPARGFFKNFAEGGMTQVGRATIDGLTDIYRRAKSLNMRRLVNDAVDSFMLIGNGLRGGDLLDLEDVLDARRYLKSKDVELVWHADDYLDSLPERPRAMFSYTKDKKQILYLRKDATRYELLHEYMHAIDVRTYGIRAYKDVGRGWQEYAAYYRLRSNDVIWNSLTDAEQAHATDYIRSLKLGFDPDDLFDPWPRFGY